MDENRDHQWALTMMEATESCGLGQHNSCLGNDKWLYVGYIFNVELPSFTNYKP